MGVLSGGGANPPSMTMGGNTQSAVENSPNVTMLPGVRPSSTVEPSASDSAQTSFAGSVSPKAYLTPEQIDALGSKGEQLPPMTQDQQAAFGRMRQRSDADAMFPNGAPSIGGPGVPDYRMPLADKQAAEAGTLDKLRSTTNADALYWQMWGKSNGMDPAATSCRSECHPRPRGPDRSGRPRS